jgi:hypothetical protein
MRWRPIITAGLTCAALAAIVLWVINSRQADHWLQVHTGTINEAGPYYGFWSGFGSDLEEFGILGAVGAGIYQLVKKYNCHEPGCWRVGQHPAAGGQFLLCYRHHPDYQGRKPTHELIQRLHREHLERQAGIHGKLHGVNQNLVAKPTAADDMHSPGAPQHLGPLLQSVDRCTAAAPNVASRHGNHAVAFPAPAPARSGDEVRNDPGPVFKDPANKHKRTVRRTGQVLLADADFGAPAP